MNPSLDVQISSAKRLAKEGDNASAMSLANALIEDHPDEIKTWMLRAYLLELREDYETAETDLTEAVERNNKEPHLHYTRGRIRYLLKRYHDAVLDFSRGLELSSFHHNDYYNDELLFWRAAALLQLGEKRRASEDLQRLPDDFMSWIDELRSKSDLISLCR